jgi:hypothetical protein
MFEQELEMEKRQSGAVPLLLITALIVALVAATAYYLVQSRRVLTSPEAAAIATAVLRAQGPATVSFHTGLVTESINEKPRDPHYRLLEKAGLLKVSKPKGDAFPVALTPKGEDLLKQIPEVRRISEKDGTEDYVVPLAQRKLVSISKITMVNPERANVEFTWAWEPNALGESFDASGSLLQTFNTWDRATLIQKYGANFFHDGAKSVLITVVKNDKKGWQIATD